MSPESRSRIALAGIVGVLGLARCTATTALPEGVHAWGRYDLCLERVADSCHGGDAGCRTPGFDDTRAAFAGFDPDAGAFHWTRGTAPSIAGVQAGRAFEVTTTQVLPDVCGCAAIARETIRGTFLDVAPPASCGGDVDAGCALPGEVPDGGEGLAPGVVELDASYPGLRGTVVDEITSADGGACGCLPCRIEYTLTGSR